MFSFRINSRKLNDKLICYYIITHTCVDKVLSVRKTRTNYVSGPCQWYKI